MAADDYGVWSKFRVLIGVAGALPQWAGPAYQTIDEARAVVRHQEDASFAGSAVDLSIYRFDADGMSNPILVTWTRCEPKPQLGW